MRKQDGRVIRIGKELEAVLDSKRGENESFDSIIRRGLGLSDRRGRNRPIRRMLYTFWIIPNGEQPIAFMNEADAKGAAIQLAIRTGRKKTDRVVMVREIV